MTDSPKPGSWIKEPAKKSVKRPFVLKPHLTSRPLSENTELTELRHSITQRGGKK